MNSMLANIVGRMAGKLQTSGTAVLGGEAAGAPSQAQGGAGRRASAPAAAHGGQPSLIDGLRCSTAAPRAA